MTRSDYIKNLLFISLLSVFLGTAVFVLYPKEQPVQAAGFPGWDTIQTIYYDSSQEDSNNNFLEQAASDLKVELEKVDSQVFIIDTVTPPSIGIFLVVDENLPALAGKNNESFQLFVDDKGIHITGKSPIATRHGVYTFLERLGYRWYFSHPTWYVVPDTLPSTLSLNEVQEPFFVFRKMRSSAGELNGGANGRTNQGFWFRRNLMASDTSYSARHTWGNFAPRSAVVAEDPTAVCYKSDGVSPQQSLPDHPIVIDRALNYARNYFNSPTQQERYTLDFQTKLSVAISPPDGNKIWCDEWRVDGKYSAQAITDKAFGLTNEVAKTLQSEYPGKYASILSYSWYPEIPSFSLEKNVYVQVTDFSRGTSKSTKERMQAFKDNGVFTGFYGYFDVWPWWKDRIPPPGKFNVFYQDFKDGVDVGIDTFYFEASDNWAPKGRLYWIMSHLMWDPYQGTASVDEAITKLLDDFYANAFGSAKEPMKRYYTRFDSQPHTDRVFGLAFRDINEAFLLAQGNPEIQERIWYVFYHTYFWWQWGDNVKGTAFSDIDDAKKMETFLWKTSDLHMVTSRLQRERVVEPALKTFGLSTTDIAALRDKTLPTSTERQAWLAEALAALGTDAIDVGIIDLKDLNLVAGGFEKEPILHNYYRSTYNRYRGQPGATILIPSAGNETIEIDLYVTNSGAGASTAHWLNPQGEIITERQITLSECLVDYFDNQPCRWNVPALKAGIYSLTFSGNPNWAVSLSRGAAHDISKGATISSSSFNAYFYVPPETPAIVIGVATGNDITITEPDGTIHSFGTGELGLRNPNSGLWKFHATPTRNENGNTINRKFWLLGVPPLLWHDPQYLLIPAGEAVSSTRLRLSSLLNLLHIFLDNPQKLTLTGTNLSTTEDFRFRLKDPLTGEVKLVARVRPISDTTVEIDFKTQDLTPLQPGFYIMEIERESDLERTVHTKQLLLTRLGDLWSPTATNTTEQKRDGRIDIFDVSRLLSKWKSTDPTDLLEADINAGPNNISLNKVDLFDANLLMKNWSQ